MISAAPDLAAMMATADREWRANASNDWTLIDFWQWPRGFHRSAWAVAGTIRWNPLDQPTAAARAVNAVLTRQCVIFTTVMTRHVRDPDGPLLAWFNAAAHEHQRNIAGMVEARGEADWGLPASRRWAARRLVRMWEQGGADAFRDLSRSSINKPSLA